MSRLWILSAMHRKLYSESVFLLNEDNLRDAGFDTELELPMDGLMDYYFGPSFSDGSVVELEVASGNIDDVVLDVELRPI